MIVVNKMWTACALWHWITKKKLFGAMCWIFVHHICAGWVPLSDDDNNDISKKNIKRVYDETFSVCDDHIHFFWKVCWFFRLSLYFARPLASRENKCAKESMFLVDELFILNGTFFFVSRLWRKIEKCTFLFAATVQIDQWVQMIQ